MRKNDSFIRKAVTVLGILVAAVTIAMLLASKQYDRLPLAIATPVLVLLPVAMERLCRCRLSLPVYLFAVLYALGPMMGHCWNFYYTISWWDKLLHICGGVMFAILGAYFFDLLTKGSSSPWGRALFALCFSMAIAVLWEFIEFGADRFLGMDMQDDTVITSITSHLFGESSGAVGSIADISSVTVNGAALPVAGYLDIGLIDTMLDMLLESLGALVVSVLLLSDQCRFLRILPRKRTAQK